MRFFGGFSREIAVILVLVRCLVSSRQGRPMRMDEKIENLERIFPGNCGDFGAGAVPQAQERKNRESLVDFPWNLR